jgi:hypothetical protein
MKQFLIQISDEHFELVEQFCKSKRMSKTEFIRRLLDQYFSLDPLKK